MATTDAAMHAMHDQPAAPSQPLTDPTAANKPALTSCSSAKRSITLTRDGLEVSPLDDREFSHMVLPNGLEVLVISDPVTESASAAMDVRVGSHSEPDAIPGLAHFCEHMLFLGTQKYPDENSYHAFLSAHGGSSNAFTAARDTNYYFDVSAKHLHEALDRFAQFFVAPLFTASATEREINAVDSENTNYLQDDWWRINQVHHSLGNKQHPFHRYAIGNVETLSTTPKAQGIDIRDALLKFYNEYYSASIMKLVVYGKEDVATLRRWVKELFAGVRTTGRTKPVFTSMPFTPDQLPRRLEVVPVKDLKIIGLVWQFPSLRQPSGPTQQHATVISHFVGHEGQGSLLSYLKNKKWVDSITAGIEEEQDEYAIFLFNAEVTAEGMNHLEEIVVAVFQYIRLLLTSPLERWVFEEMERLAVMHFLFQSKQRPINYTSTVAMNMQNYDKQHYLSQGLLDYPYEEGHVKALLELMSPQKMKLLIVSNALESVCDSEERWYGTKYRDLPVDADLLKRLENCGTNDCFALPPPNDLVSDNFELIDAAKLTVAPTNAPRLVRDDNYCRVWYKPDVHFKKPRTHISLSFFRRTSIRRHYATC
ncbi:TPA: hypothetical protein N0F65_012741 [Lagenidium giganteum]|uniref:Insulin-degrading enzyme n=1 Tax=Lagenidium giganteum TaxID=4803 RepID=A0AAV2YFG0_9STRA|nr:TPA: hypothetical protein N0F65_012741 [Lagenidium giganteum]